jgi:hypothetical protein
MADSQQQPADAEGGPAVWLLREPWATALTGALTGLDRPALAADLSRRALALVEPLLQAPKE